MLGKKFDKQVRKKRAEAIQTFTKDPETVTENKMNFSLRFGEMKEVYPVIGKLGFQLGPSECLEKKRAMFGAEPDQLMFIASLKFLPGVDADREATLL